MEVGQVSETHRCICAACSRARKGVVLLKFAAPRRSGKCMCCGSVEPRVYEVEDWYDPQQTVDDLLWGPK